MTHKSIEYYDSVTSELTKRLLAMEEEKKEALRLYEEAKDSEQKALTVKDKWYILYQQVKRNYETAKKNSAYWQGKAVIVPEKIVERIKWVIKILIFQ
jgi:hypothetical protein